MKRFIASLLCAAVFLGISPGYAAFAENGAAEIYVAPDGDDSAAGTIDAPLATMQGAKEKVAQIKKEGVPVNVYFRGGEYRILDTVNFTKNDSGTKDAPITYMAYPDEEPVFTGAVKFATEDFERVSGEMYKRLPAVSRDHVGVADLTKKGVTKLIEFTAETPIGGLGRLPTEAIIQDANVEFYFNDRSMTLAEWPNGSEEYAKISKISEKWIFGGDTQGRIKNWVTAENPIMLGFIRVGFGQTRAKVMGFDLENETLIFQKPDVNDSRPASGHYNGYTTKHTLGDNPIVGSEWKIQNLIEELDVPGEFYLDYDNLKLYFYPPGSTLGVDMELAVGEKNFINMKDTEYVTFKGLNIEKNRETAVILDNTDNIKFLSCTVNQIAMKGIVMTNECHNTLIDGCDFFSSGHLPITINELNYEHIDLDKPDRVNLTPQNNVVNNCHFWNTSNQFSGTTSCGAVDVHGVGNAVTNCKFHETAGNVIYWTGNDHRFQNNEFYNILKFVRDQGGIYNGRSLVQRGVDISYNYFHDVNTTSDDEGYVRCLYNDDTLGGVYLHHNILVDVEQAFNFAGGTDTKFDYNIIARVEVPGTFGSQGWGTSQFKTAYNSFRNKQLPEVFSLEAFKKYENMRRVFFGTNWPTYGASFKGNLFYANDVKYPNISEGAAIQGASLDDNYIYDGEDYMQMFTDPDNGDFTIREEYKLPDGYEELKNIKLDKIGNYVSETRDNINTGLSEFNLYYPYNFTDELSGGEVYLKWEECIGADSYIVEIALDEEFTKLAGTYTTPVNHIYIDELDNDSTEYFWRVKAVAMGKDCSETKLNSNGARRFRTKAFDILDTALLEETVKKAENVLSQVTEGVEGGNIAYGATDNLKHHISAAKEILASSRGLQNEIDTLVTLLEKEMANVGKTVVMNYSGIESIINAKESWVNNTEGNGLSHLEDGIAVNNTSAKEMVSYTNIAAPIERNKLFCFKLNIDIPDGGGEGLWQAIAFQRKEDAGKLIFSAGNYGYLFIVKNHKIEIQIYNGQGGRIIETIPNSIPRGKDTDIKFGVLDFGAGQRIVLEIDGKTVFDHAEYEDILRDDLYFSVYDATKRDGALQCNTMMIKLADPEDIPDSDINLGNRLSVGDNDIAGAIKAMSGGDELTINSGSKVYTEKLDNIKAIGFNIKPSLSDKEQGVVFRLNTTEFNQDTSDYYMLSLKNGKVLLKKNQNANKQTLFIKNTDIIKSGEWNNVKLYTCFENAGTRIIVHVGGKELINYLDTQPIKSAGYFGVFNNSSGGLSVKP